MHFLEYHLAATNSDGGLAGGWALALLILVSIVAVAVVALVIAAVVSVLRRRVLAAGGKAVWILLICAFPVLGAVVWFIWGRSGEFTRQL